MHAHVHKHTHIHMSSRSLTLTHRSCSIKKWKNRKEEIIIEEIIEEKFLNKSFGMSTM